MRKTSSLPSFVGLLLLAAICMLAVTFSCKFSASTANISKVTLCKGVTEKTEPVEPTTVFPQDQDVFNCVVHVANAPSDTKVRSIWVGLDTELGKDMTIDSVEFTIEKDSDVHFSLTRGKKFWPVGKFQVKLYLDGKFDRDVDFTVEKTTVITDIMTCKGVTEAMEAIAPTTVFPRDQQVFHCVLTVLNVQGETKVKSVWVAVDVGDVKDTKIDEATLTTSKDQTLHFSLGKDTGYWPVGEYRLDLYVNEKPKNSVEFSVE
jgi:hypothetical protein